MTNPIYAQQAELAAERIDAEAFGMDPLTIITIITQVLPILASCFNRNDSPDPAEAAERFREYHSRNPEKLRKRVARRVRAESDKPMSKEQSFAMADAIIAQIVESDDEVIYFGCNEAPEGL